MSNYIFPIAVFFVTSLWTVACIWFGVCLGSRYVDRVEGSGFLYPLGSKNGADKISEFAGDDDDGL